MKVLPLHKIPAHIVPMKVSPVYEVQAKIVPWCDDDIAWKLSLVDVANNVIVRATSPVPYGQLRHQYKTMKELAEVMAKQDELVRQLM